MKKNLYINPVAEVLTLSTEDILTLSLLENGNGDLIEWDGITPYLS